MEVKHFYLCKVKHEYINDLLGHDSICACRTLNLLTIIKHGKPCTEFALDVPNSLHMFDMKMCNELNATLKEWLCNQG